MNAFDIKTQYSLSRVLRQVKTSDKDYPARLVPVILASLED